MMSDFSSQLDRSEIELLKNNVKNNCFDGVAPLEMVITLRISCNLKQLDILSFAPVTIWELLMALEL